jgi:hypothetical protein
VQDIQNRLNAAVRPTIADLDVAINAILTELATGGLKHTRNLMDQVARAMDVQALDWQEEEGISRADVLRARAFGTTITALAYLESTGHALPFGNQRLWGDMTELIVSWTPSHSQGGFRLGDQFNFPLAEVYVLPRTGLAPGVDLPFVLTEHLPMKMAEKARRVVLEAADAYRARLYVGAAMLLGTASEAAWEHVATIVEEITGDDKLTKILAEPLSSTAHIQHQVVEVLRPLKLRRVNLAQLEGMAITYRELRNHAVHEPEGAFDQGLFAPSVIGTLMFGSIEYFTELYRILEVIGEPRHGRLTD